jgi:hypothetical protein
MTSNERARSLWHKSKQFFRNFNVFPSVPPSTNEYDCRNERISTRVFIFCFILILTILLFYISFVNVTKTVNIKTPTLAQYSQLYATYPQTLTCPCTTISINYGKFLHVEYSFHQVCSSIFVNENWTDYLATFADDNLMLLEDFRWTGTYTFQTLSVFCNVVNETISSNLISFYSSQYVSAFVVSSELFQTQITSVVDQFKSSIINSFLLFLSMIRSTNQGNSLLSALQTNSHLVPSFAYDDGRDVTNLYSNCDCDYLATCVEPSAIFDLSSNTIVFSVPGLYIGCFVIEALLQSTLECFYDQTCINQLQSYLVSSLPMYATALNSSLPTQYFIDSTIEELLDNLMVEQWNSSVMYDGYYNECQPAQCTYTHQAKNDIIYIVTTLIGLVGGLITVLKLVVPRMVKLFVRYILRQKRVTPVMPIVQT